MRLLTFIPEAPDASTGDTASVTSRTGLLLGEEVVDLTAPEVSLPAIMPSLLAGGPAALDRAEAAARSRARRWPVEQVTVRAPVEVPPKLLAIGMNYRAHIAELGREPPEFQYWFNKQRTCVVGPGDPIVVPSVSEQVDYEGELAVVIGRRCRHVPLSRALEVVAGVTVINDVSVRDWQDRTPTFTMGKSFDSHGPLGPTLVTLDELDQIGGVQALRLRTTVNSDIRQDSTTADMIFSVSEMIAYLTSAFPLEPGDVLATGTPSGVARGRQPPPWLRPGDVVKVEIEGVGVLENPVVAEGLIDPEGLDG